MSKICERAALNQFIAYMKVKKRLTEHQTGNKGQHSTETMNAMMKDKFLEGMNKEMLTLMVLLDLSKAFDSIDHAKLLLKLSSLGVSSSALECRSGGTCMIASSIYELALKCLECVNLHTEFHKDPSTIKNSKVLDQCN